MRTREILVNGRSYTAQEHGQRDDGLRKPQYIANCEAKSRLVKFGEEPKHFYFGYYETDRLTFEMEGSWWFIDDLELFTLFDNARQSIRVTT